MEANDFIARLKAEGTEKDLCDLQRVYDDYKVILKNLAAKDKGAFSLNVLCILCRNLDKVPSWRDKVDGKMLVTLSVECVRETGGLPRTDQVKVLACIYHIHKHVIKLTSIPPELVLKLSFLPFEVDTKSLLQEYCKTYWNIVVDRISYIEKLKAKLSISKILPKIVEDVLKVIHIYDSVQFCTNILTFVVKKLHFLYNDTKAKELHQHFSDIFKALSSKTDLASFKKLPEKDIMDIYKKFNDCFYVIAENSSKTKFEVCNLNIVVRTAITILGHNTEVMRCLETFFLNGFCSIFENLTNATNIENVLNNMVASSLSIEKLGHEKALTATYPFLNQFLRLLIEFTVSNTKLDWSLYFNEKIQIGCLNLMLFLSTRKCEQFLKCENCKVKTSLHDSIRLLFLIKHFPTSSITQNLDITNTLPVYYKLVTVQHKILFELKRLGCPNHDKCFRKLQTDIHNTAIALNKANYYNYSIKLFNLYVELELRYFKDGNDLKNISRALYNKSICELDDKMYVEALQDAYLSLIFSLPDGLGSEKFMSLVMDIKAKALKSYEGNHDEFQSTSVLDVCKKCVEAKSYGNIKPFLINLDFSEILKHEFDMYAKLWPSIVPIGGIWQSLYELYTEKPSWILKETQNENATILQTLLQVILKTCTVVRTIHNDLYSDIVKKLLDVVTSDMEASSFEFVYAALLFLQCEYDLAAASQKYEWKTAEPSMDPDQAQVVRTIPQEHEATKRAIEAVHVLSQAVKDIEAAGKPSWLQTALQLYQVFVMHLLHLRRDAPALQLAHSCCVIAQYVGDSASYIRNASILISQASSPTSEVTQLVERSCKLCDEVSLQTKICFMCDTAIYYIKTGSKGVASRLVQLAQATILEATEKNPDLNLDLPIGRLLQAQAHLCNGVNALSVASGIQRHYLAITNTEIARLLQAQVQLCNGVNALSVASGVQRHYLAITNTETKWSYRRLLALTLKHHITATSINHTRACRSLLLWRRARCACAACVPAASAAGLASLYMGITNVHKMDDAQTKIDNRLKHILGLQPSNEPQTHVTEPSKPQLFTPRHENLETMLEDHVFKKTQLSPSLPYTTVLGFKLPDFFKHGLCDCSLCDNPISSIIACATSGLESSMYYRAKEMDIARNYFDGTIKSFEYAESKIKSYFNRCKDQIDSYIVNMVENTVFNEFRRVQIEILIEAAFFELTNQAYEKADDFIVRIHDILQDLTSAEPYLKNEVINLMIASAKVRKTIIQPKETGLEIEMESLKLSPYKEPPKTPVNKPNAPPKLTKNIVKNEELPIVKRKVIKLNLDEDREEKEIRPTRKRAEFKIPVPVTAKPVLEVITPRTRPKPDIIVTKPSEDVKMTPKCEENDFFTPKSTPAEQFFTPMTSIKTYSKKSLRSHIVKNLEAEFSTPKGDKENSTLNTEVTALELPKTSGRSIRSKVDKKGALKRATSPGKLPKEVKPTRSSRLKAPINFKVHEDNGK